MSTCCIASGMQNPSELVGRLLSECNVALLISVERHVPLQQRAHGLWSLLGKYCRRAGVYPPCSRGYGISGMRFGGVRRLPSHRHASLCPSRTPAGKQWAFRHERDGPRNKLKGCIHTCRATTYDEHIGKRPDAISRNGRLFVHIR